MFSFESRERHVTFVRFLTVFARVTAPAPAPTYRQLTVLPPALGGAGVRHVAPHSMQLNRRGRYGDPRAAGADFFLRKRPPAAASAVRARHKDSKAFNPGFSLLSSARISFFLSVARTKPPCTELQPSAIESCASSIDAGTDVCPRMG